MCPRCSSERDERDGPYFVCEDCRWRWTVSITGTVYLQGRWAPVGQDASRDDEDDVGRRLLGSVRGLDRRLAQDASQGGSASEEPKPAGPPRALPGFRPAEIERLRTIRAAVEGAYFNEGVPLDWLRVHGVSLSSEQEDDQVRP
jgi:hypothetical protein